MLEVEYRRGFEEGKRIAAQSAQEALKRQMEEDQQTVARIDASVREQLGQVRERLEREAYHFALAVAARVVRHEVAIDSDVVIRLIQEALRRVAGVESVRLRVNPNDEALVRTRRPDLLNATDTVRDLVIESDEKVERGGCILETASGTVDARTSTQLEQIESALFGQAVS